MLTVGRPMNADPSMPGHLDSNNRNGCEVQVEDGLALLWLSFSSGRRLAYDSRPGRVSQQFLDLTGRPDGGAWALMCNILTSEGQKICNGSSLSQVCRMERSPEF